MTRRKTIGLALVGVGTLGALAILALSWSSPATSHAPSESKSGIPGLSVEDVRDHKVLWHDIRALERMYEQGQIDSHEYRYKVIELSAVYLEIDETDVEDFTRVASVAVTSVRESFLRMRRGRSGYEAFRKDMDVAETRVSEFLTGGPRHELFEPECAKWLRRLALGPSFEPDRG